MKMKLLATAAALALALPLFTVQPILAETLSGEWTKKRGSGGGALALKVTKTGASVQIKGSCSGNAWLPLDPPNAIILEGGKVVVKRRNSIVQIKRPCGRTNVNASVNRDGSVNLNFRNADGFGGKVR